MIVVLYCNQITQRNQEAGSQILTVCWQKMLLPDSTMREWQRHSRAASHSTKFRIQLDNCLSRNVLVSVWKVWERKDCLETVRSVGGHVSDMCCWVSITGWSTAHPPISPVPCGHSMLVQWWETVIQHWGRHVHHSPRNYFDWLIASAPWTIMGVLMEFDIVSCVSGGLVDCHIIFCTYILLKS